MNVWLGLPVLAALAPNVASQLHPEFVIGRDASGKLAVRFDASKPYTLPASRFPWIEGYADAMPGFSTLFEPTSKDGLLPLDSQANLTFVLVSADASATVWNDQGTGTMKAGESFNLGNPPFDSHAVWNIAKGAAIKPYTLRMRIHDSTGQYRDSDDFAPSFMPDDANIGYVCPMGCRGGAPSEQPGRCAECGMSLKLMSGRSYRVSVKPEGPAAEGGAVRANIATTLRFKIDAPDGKPATDFEIVHEKLLHLLMVSNDLAWFAHEHPEIQPDGTFALTTSFPHGGTYTLFSDFTPRRVGMQVVPVELTVQGDVARPVSLAISTARSQKVDDYVVELRTTVPLKSIQMQQLTFRISRGGVPLTDLEPFLGTTGHLIMISQDRSRFVHSHPIESASAAAGGAARIRGPEVVFQAQFPVPGLYKAWGQFQHRGRVITAPFVIDVLPPRATAGDPASRAAEDNRGR